MKLDEMEFGRRLANEKELAERNTEAARRENSEWDETGNFLLYPSLVGIKGTHERMHACQIRFVSWACFADFTCCLVNSHQYDNEQSRSDTRKR